VLALSQGCLDLLQGKLALIEIELLGSAAEPVPLQGLHDRPQESNLNLENLQNIELSGLLEDERGKILMSGKVRIHQHRSSESGGRATVNRQSAVRSGGVRPCTPAPVQAFEQGAQLCRRQPHHAFLDRRPLEPARVQPLGYQAQPGAVPSDKLNPIAALARNT
jgi:hypothetical protein